MSNIGKYQSTNPFKQVLLKRFLGTTRSIISQLDPGTVLDIGTGEGLYWKHDHKHDVVGVDLRLDALRESRTSAVAPIAASATSLPFGDDSFDYVTAIEILEHLPEPELAVREAARVTRRGGLVTVPWEPWFSIMVLVGTGSHGRRLGREPEHIQAFGPKDLARLLNKYFPSVAIRTSLPWLVAEVSLG